MAVEKAIDVRTRVVPVSLAYHPHVRFDVRGSEEQLGSKTEKQLCEA